MFGSLARPFAVLMVVLAVLVWGSPSAQAGIGWHGSGPVVAAACTVCAEPSASETCIPVSCPAAVLFAAAVMVPKRDDSTPFLAHQHSGSGIDLNLDPPPPKPS